jgi:hypothetical protein
LRNISQPPPQGRARDVPPRTRETHDEAQADWLGDKDHHDRALSGHRREGAVELAGTSGFQELKMHAQRSGYDLQVVYRERVGRIARVREDRHSTNFGDGFPEQL